MIWYYRKWFKMLISYDLVKPLRILDQMINFQNSDNDLISRLPAEGSQTNLDIKLVSKINIFDRKLNFKGSFFQFTENFAVKKWNFLKKLTLIGLWKNISEIFKIREILIFDKKMIFFNELFNAKFRRHFSCSTFPITPKSQICPKMMKFWIIKIFHHFLMNFHEKHPKNMKFFITLTVMHH